MFETIAQAISVIVPLALTNTVLISAVKFLANGSMGKGVLRALLGIASVGGLIAVSAFTGEPVDVNKITGIVELAIMALVSGFMSHGAYKAITLAPRSK